MFTIRFNCHGQIEYKSYSCRSYVVEQGDEGGMVVRMSFPDGEVIQETVGGRSPYCIAYVTNSESRTIDVVRGG